MTLPKEEGIQEQGSESKDQNQLKIADGGYQETGNHPPYTLKPITH